MNVGSGGARLCWCVVRVCWLGPGAPLLGSRFRSVEHYLCAVYDNVELGHGDLSHVRALDGRIR
jgi:hypothetical protein